MEKINEKRADSERIKISFPVECNVPAGKSYFYTVCKDLSQGGLKILSNNFIAKGNILKLNINLIDNVVNLKAKVAWCSKERASERYVTGLQFVEINKESQGALSRFLNRIYNS
jgi:c-di-GMP-binding flagellar brake protein YcgR